MTIYEHAEEPMPPKPDYDPAMDDPAMDEIDGMEQLIDNAPALIRAAAEVMGVDPEDITSKRRTFAISLARKIVMTLWAEAHSLQDAARIVGKSNHTSSHYARRTIHEKLLHCHKTRERVRKILQKYENILAETTNQQ